MTQAAIAARQLEKRFGPVRGLRGVDLEVAAGSALAVLGANGAGKTTLLRLLAGLARPTAGSLEIGGEPVTRRSTRARVGYIGHATLLYPDLTARENLIFVARLYGVADPAARAAALLSEALLEHLADRPVRELSRGSAQRLAIARALVHDPAVVLLDEPFTGLDLGAAERLVRRLGSLREQGVAAVLVTHDVARACQVADAAIVLARGRVAQRLDAPLDALAIERAQTAAAEAAP